MENTTKSLEIKVYQLQTIVPFYQKLMSTGMSADKAMDHARDSDILEKELALIQKAEISVLAKADELRGPDGVLSKEDEALILEELNKLRDKDLKVEGLSKITVLPKEVSPIEVKILSSIGLLDL